MEPMAARCSDYELSDADAMARANPESFVTEPLRDRSALRPGALVKICLMDRRSRRGERVWVHIDHADEGPRYRGVIDNPIVVVGGMMQYDTVWFGPRHVYAIDQRGSAPPRQGRDQDSPELHRGVALFASDDYARAILADPPPAHHRESLCPMLLVPTLRRDAARVREVLTRFALSVDLANSNGITALYAAAYKGRADMVLALLDLGASTAVLASNGMTQFPRYTPLLVACRQGHLDVVQALVERGGVSVHESGTQGQRDGRCMSPLEVALSYDNLDIARYLLERGADPNKHESRLAPLFFAKSSETVRLLLEHGADPDIRGHGGRTPLMYACHFSRYDVAHTLIEANADCAAVDESGSTALEQAIAEGNSRARALLESRTHHSDETHHDGSPGFARDDEAR